MLRVTAVTAVGASRRALLASLQQQCPRPSAHRAYTTAEASFSVHTPKAKKRSNHREASNNRKHPGRSDRPHTGQRSSPSSSTSTTLTRTKRVLALAHHQAQYTSTSSGTTNSQLIALQSAIDGQDINSISSLWTQVGDDIQNLGQSEHRKLLRLCSSYSSSIRDANQAQYWQSRFRDFASAAALTGDVDLTSGWFRVLLANGQAQDVVSIWQDIVRLRLESGPKSSSFTHDDSESISTAQATTESFVRLDESIHGDRIDIHDMVCLVAFACTHSSQASHSIELFDKVEFGSPFRLFFNMSRAERLFTSTPVSSFQAPNANKPINWNTMQTNLWNIELARGLSSGSGGPQRIARLLGSLFQMRQIDQAYSIFQTAMRASSPPDAWLSLEPLGHDSSSSSPPTFRAQWTESCWSVCLSNLIAAERTELAMDVWTQLQQKRIYPTPRIWNALLDGYGRAKNHTAAVQTWSAAQAQASKESSTLVKLPDEQMYTTMIDIHFRARKVDEAMVLFSDMLSNSDRHGGQLQVQAETFNAVLHGLFLNGAHAHAQSLLDQMLAKGPAPNISTINTFLRAHSRVGDLDSVASTLRLADRLKLTPDVVTFTTILDALLRKGGDSATAAVAKTLDIMKGMGVQPNVVTYTAMIKACLVGAEAAQLDLASQSLFGDAADRKTRQLSSNEVRIEAALELLERLVKAKVAPSEITYGALIGGCLQNPDAVAHAFATKAIPRQFCSLPKPMHRLGESHQTAQRWSQESPQVSLALFLLEQMKGRGLPPSSATFRYLIEGLCGPHTDQAAFVRAMDFVDDMLLRTHVLETSRRLGPFASVVVKGTEVYPPTLHAPSHKTWMVLFSSLLDRLENGPRDRMAVTTCARALVTATRLVREMGSLAGAEGGLSLSRLIERAASLTSRMPR